MSKLLTISSTAIAILLTAAAGTQPAKTSLLPDSQLTAITSEASGALAKDTIIALGHLHRVHASPGFHQAAEYIADRARDYGLEEVHIESFPADGKTTYNSFKAYLGWEPKSGVLTELGESPQVIADFSKMPVALADYSNDADVTTDLIDVGAGTSEKDYAGKDVKGRIVLAGGNVAAVHHEAVDQRGAAGVLSYQPNQVTGWSGDYPDLVRWGHLSPYNTANKFAFMISLRKARELQARLNHGEIIKLHAEVSAQMKPTNFEVVTGIIRGTDPAAGEIVYSCHLCHQKPGANDNASGAATILEDARILARLIREKKLPRPKRNIRFLWPPEIAGTMCYFARHADEVAKMVAVIHMDMVGGDPKLTHAIFHLTRTPASLPSFTNDVAAVFGSYVYDGARRAAMDGDFTNANISTEGSKEMMLADFHDFTMGSDHDVYQEGSFHVPAIYMNDWPDVFIHTNGDVPANMDATKLQRVAVIGASSGYFMASAGEAEAKILMGEVFARGGERQSQALRRAFAESDILKGLNIIKQSTEQERSALDSIKSLDPQSKTTSDRVEDLKQRLSMREAEAFMALRDIHGADAIHEGPKLLQVYKRNPKVLGGMDIYYYDYIKDHVPEAPNSAAPAPPLDGTLAYEALNLVDGKRNVSDIHHVLTGAYGPVEIKKLVDYLKLLERAGVVTLAERTSAK